MIGKISIFATGRRLMRISTSLREISSLFLKLGSISFGGPAVIISMLEKEVVRKKQWMDHQHFLDLVGATNLIPGPNASEMTMHCGYERAGLKGLLAAGLTFLLPAVLITTVFAWLYRDYGHLPNVEAFMYGIKPAVIAIIISAMVPLGRKALKSVITAVLGAVSLIACLFGLNEIAVLFGCGIAGIVIYWIKSQKPGAGSFFPLLLLQAGATVPYLKIFLIFLKIGAILYGSGYVLFAFLDTELVSREIISRQVLMDAIAVGQITPGPVLSAATFIGFQIGGIWGALLATAGIFLPSFIFVAALNPLIPKLRKSGIMAAFLDAVNISSVAIIIAVAIAMGRDTLTDWKSVIIMLCSISALIIFKRLNSAFIVVGGAGLGYLLTLF